MVLVFPAPESNRRSRLERPPSSPLADGNEWSRRRASNSGPDYERRLPRSCHIPICKRTFRFVRSHCRSGKSGAPPGIRTRTSMFLRHARIPIPPAGQKSKKARSPHGEFRALRKRKSPERFRGPGLGAVSALALAFLRFRTRAVLAEFPAILYEALPARWQG